MGSLAYKSAYSPSRSTCCRCVSVCTNKCTKTMNTHSRGAPSVRRPPFRSHPRCARTNKLGLLERGRCAAARPQTGWVEMEEGQTGKRQNFHFVCRRREHSFIHTYVCAPFAAQNGRRAYILRPKHTHTHGGRHVSSFFFRSFHCYFGSTSRRHVFAYE